MRQKTNKRKKKKNRVQRARRGTHHEIKSRIGKGPAWRVITSITGGHREKPRTDKKPLAGVGPKKKGKTGPPLADDERTREGKNCRLDGIYVWLPGLGGARRGETESSR